jgi:hypothetical protein
MSILELDYLDDSGQLSVGRAKYSRLHIGTTRGNVTGHVVDTSRTRRISSILVRREEFDSYAVGNVL